mgnify:CR=1 FL=1
MTCPGELQAQHHLQRLHAETEEFVRDIAEDADQFGWDNEFPLSEVEVPAFEIDVQPVCWSQFAEFVDDGGYDRAELWHPGGWEWLQAQSAAQRRFQS